MSQIPSLTTFPSTQTTGQADALGDVDLDQFLNLMIAELQNQDPLDPMDNSEMLSQISQIREIGATERLNETLATIALGQNLTTAGTLIGKRISALSAEGEDVEGVVDRVTIAGGGDTGKRTIAVHVGEHEISLTNVREITG